ncbi:MAG TPA: glycosyltransferase family A protein [Bryobacteraceae bacterium]|jgi:glycosyltransferase involved in cell wall biosynthesis|nr:glycosyltransferase family A protein [Bryobacteraceae bacterium]
MTTTPPPPAVSVIIPAYNVTPFIGDALDSLRAQTFRDFETIVVNDGCPDSSNLERVLEPYRGEIVYIRQENQGVAAARNAALRAARAPLVALLDPDDMWEPEYLEVQTGLLASNPEAGVACANVTFIGETFFAGQTFLDLYPDRGEITFCRLLDQRCRIFSSVIARRELILRAGLFDPALRSAEDLHLWLRLAHMGTRFIRNHQPLIRYRARPDSLSNDPTRIGPDALKVYKDLSETLNLNAADRACLEVAMRREEATLDFYLGKKALYAGRNQEAKERLGRANLVLRSRKIIFALLALRIAPGLLHKLVRWRNPTEYKFLH